MAIVEILSITLMFIGFAAVRIGIPLLILCLLSLVGHRVLSPA